ncbi:hypothetical protein MmiAt1_02850 [Methanimicrococcus sp. At1]|uniref:Uncharacterized protein n=1 Tax=Methanimicrococcus hacksteinii TaxID=3028293 RepID=A0ABU3VMX0_9EURY|nr:hypothetical protein [Methanimicrococcus sp. At1]
MNSSHTVLPGGQFRRLLQNMLWCIQNNSAGKGRDLREQANRFRTPKANRDKL